MRYWLYYSNWHYSRFRCNLHDLIVLFQCLRKIDINVDALDGLPNICLEFEWREKVEGLIQWKKNAALEFHAPLFSCSTGYDSAFILYDSGFFHILGTKTLNFDRNLLREWEIQLYFKNPQSWTYWEILWVLLV